MIRNKGKLWGAASVVGVVALGACFDNGAPTPPSPTAAVSQAEGEGEGEGNCQAPGCGNGVIEAGESCDDGNTESGDGCTTACLKERVEVPPTELIRLAARSFTPDEPVPQSLVDAAAANQTQGMTELHAIAVFEQRPDSDSATQWAEAGVLLEDYIHENAYIVMLPLNAEGDLQTQLDALRESIGASHLAAFEPDDKAAPSLLATPLPTWAVDPSGNLLVMVKLYREVDETSIDAVVNAFHAGSEAAAEPGARLREIRLAPSNVDALLASPFVEWVELGPAPPAPLMEAVRANMNVTNADRPSLCLTGDGVLLSTIVEQPSLTHDDYYHYDANGTQGASRILSGGTTTGDSHADHVVGIMLGNGWLSEGHGDNPFQWRGVAPEAEFVEPMPNSTTLAPHVTSSSWVTMGFDCNYDSGISTWDERIRNDGNAWYHHTQVWAAGNNGGGYSSGQGASFKTRGNYAVVAVAKNMLTVGNVFAEDSRWASSSMGPTFDGRIKPDISAPGCRIRHPYHNVRLETEHVKIIRTGNDASFSYMFDTSGDFEGWEPINLWRKDISWPLQIISPDGMSIRWLLKPYRPHIQWSHHAPVGGTLRDVLDYYDGTYGGVGKSGDVVEIKYRFEDLPMWNGGEVTFFWWNGPGGTDEHHESFPVQTDGDWHTLQIPIGTLPGYVGDQIHQFRFSPFAWNPGAVVSTTPNDSYGGKCGTSMAAPAATGAIALLLEQLTISHNVDLDSQAPSPFDYNNAGTGSPLPSTMKALLLHSARDVARIKRDTDTDGADTEAPPEYHKGPDFTTGYGTVDAEEAARLLELNAANALPIIERDAVQGTHAYSLNVPAGATAPVRVTLAWDDEGVSPIGIQHDKKLVNDLKLLLVSPTGAVHHPWSIDLPYDPDNCGGCDAPEVIGDEPVVSSDFVPARRDIENDRDNVEMAFIETPEPGNWSVRVTSPSLPLGPQPYSLIIGQPPKPAADLAGGKVVFVSTRQGAPQLYMQINDGSNTPPTALTGPGDVRHPEWSPDGRYVVYVSYDANTLSDALVVLDTVGNNNQTFIQPFAGFKRLSHPSWTKDGSEILVSYFNTTQQHRIGAVEATSGTPRTLYDPALYPSSMWSPDAPVHAGPDPTGVDYVIVHGDGACNENALFRIRTDGSDMERMWADGFPSNRARFPAISPDGDSVLFASDDYTANIAGFQDVEVVQLTRFDGVTTRRTSAAGNQLATFAIGGRGEWVAESNPSVSANRNIVVQQNGIQVALFIDDAGNAYDDYHPSWWKADPNTPFIDPNAPGINCPAAIAFPADPWPNCGPRTPPTVAATSSCGVPVSVVADPSLLTGNGPHTVTYTATDRLGNTASCQSVISYGCTGMPN